MSDKVDYLDEDPVISSQKYCVISVLTPKNFKDFESFYFSLLLLGLSDNLDCDNTDSKHPVDLEQGSQTQFHTRATF